MTIDRTRERVTNQNELVEKTRDRIILEHMGLQISLETPRVGGKVHEMWKARTPARTEMPS